MVLVDGGAPISCEIGLAVLDAIEWGAAAGERAGRRHAPAGAAAGARGRHELAGAAHGVGLYLGLELVRDRDTLEPAARGGGGALRAPARAGAIVQPTGDHMNVLKIKPPLVERRDADWLLETLDGVLTRGW